MLHLSKPGLFFRQLWCNWAWAVLEAFGCAGNKLSLARCTFKNILSKLHMKHWLPAASEHTSKVWRGVAVVQSYKVQHGFNCLPQEKAFILLMGKSEESVTVHFTVSRASSLSHQFSMLWGLSLIDHSIWKLFHVLCHYWCFLPTFFKFALHLRAGRSKTAHSIWDMGMQQDYVMK